MHAQKDRSTAPDAGLPPNRFGQGGMHRFVPAARARDVRGTLRKLIEVYLQEKKALLFAFAFQLCCSVVLLFAPRLIGQAIDAISIGDAHAPDDALVTGIGIALLCGYIGSWLCATAQTWIMNGASQRIVRTLRTTLFDKLQKLPLTYLDRRTHGELMSRLTNDIDNVSTTIAASTIQLMDAVIMVTGAVVLMITLSPPLALVTLLTMPLVALLTRAITKRSKKEFIGQQSELGRLGGTIEETITGQRMVKAFHQERRIIRQFEHTNQRLLQFSMRAQILSGFLMPMMNVITNVGYAFVAGVGGAMAVNGLIEVGVIASFITYSRLFVRPLNAIAGSFNTLQAGLAGAERVFDILAETQEPPDAPDAVELAAPRGQVSFQAVSFAYTPGKNVLKQVSFDVEPGQTVALVGKTGAGKTTIANLLARFYDVTEGTILLDGRDLRAYTRDSLRRAFTVVLQDTCLFTGTILDNIRYGRPEATEGEVIAAATAANADPFIRRLPQGYDTLVSSTIDSLSQGQRQLIAIARAVLCSAPILILDEATSSVDTRTELKIQDALLRFSAGRTSFVIAHRLSTIQNADRILVMEDGRIAESGTHRALLDAGGRYARMYWSQISTEND